MTNLTIIKATESPTLSGTIKEAVECQLVAISASVNEAETIDTVATEKLMALFKTYRDLWPEKKANSAGFHG